MKAQHRTNLVTEAKRIAKITSLSCLLGLVFSFSGCIPSSGEAPDTPVDVPVDVVPEELTHDRFGLSKSIPPLFNGVENAAERKIALRAVTDEIILQMAFDRAQPQQAIRTTAQALRLFELYNTYAFRLEETIAPPGFGAALSAVTKQYVDDGTTGHLLTDLTNNPKIPEETYGMVVEEVFFALSAALQR